MKNKLIPIILMILVLSSASRLYSQTAHLEGQIFEYATYYISSFDLQTGSSQVQFFNFNIISDSYPIYVKLYFKGDMISESLGIDEHTTIVELQTAPFEIQAQVVLDSRDMSSENNIIYDMASPPNAVEIHGQLLEVMNPAQFDAILSSVITSGKLADGEYTFEVKLFSGSNPNNLTLTDEVDKVFYIHSPVSISLESPGGDLQDTTSNIVFTTYPIFNWYSETCQGCENHIRVAEFNPSIHSSIDEAIEDDMSLPFNSGGNWEAIGSFNSFQYPLSGARPLEFGNVYVWQIRQTLLSTAGQEELLSPVYAFKISDMNSPSSPETTNPVIQMLQQALGDAQFNQLMAAGQQLNGYIPTGDFSINGIPVDESSVAFILNQVINQNIQVQSIQVED